MLDPVKEGLYDAVRRPNQSAYGLAIRDSFQAPKVVTITAPEYTGAIGEKILVRATDDFKVASVKVSVYNTNEELIERGVIRGGRLESPQNRHYTNVTK